VLLHNFTRILIIPQSNKTSKALADLLLSIPETRSAQWRRPQPDASFQFLSGQFVGPLSPQTIQVLDAFLQAPRAWRYGYDVSRDTGIKSGTLYPILMRLADVKLLETRWGFV
jgi:hypothetical protein